LPLFSKTKGTPLSELIRKGSLSILCLARLEPELRTVISSVIVKSMMKQRRDASFLEKRLALESLPDEKKSIIKKELSNFIGRSVLVLDEAQILLPVTGGGQAAKALESYVLEGRNYGLSLWLATQRPTGAISPAARSQVDTFMIHRLSVKEDIDGIYGALQSELPNKITIKRKNIDFKDLIRRLETGQAIISSSDTQASSNRAYVINIHPRITCHGGKAF
jgi:DNA helicase HerA-like ATPase